MKRLLPLMKISAAVAAVLVAGNCYAQNTWTGAGGDTKWENGANWASGSPPTDPNAVSDDNGGATFIDGDFDVLYDEDTWQWVIDNNQRNSAGPDVVIEPGGVNLNTQHWGMGQLSMGTVEGVTGTNTFTFDPGETFDEVAGILRGNPVNVPTTAQNIFGQRTGTDSTVNIQSGNITLGGGGNNAVSLGIEMGSSGTINVTGGLLTLTRSQFLIAADRFGVSRDGSGTFNISGGGFRTRTDVTIGANGTFNVQGSAPTQVGIGSAFSGDGEWVQVAGGTLRTGLDAGGITPIFVDDFEDDGNGMQGNVTFEAGAILDPYDAGGATGALTTVMIWEGTLDNGANNDNLVLSAEAVAAGWEMVISGNELQVQNPTLDGVLGDFTGDGVVDCDDLDGYVGNIGDAADGQLAALDLDGDGVLSAADANTHITTLVVTSNDGTGTVLGDFDCDGLVNVLGDAFILVANLNDPVASYSLGDANFDGEVSVLGDAFILVANLGFPNN
ncbi:hypothetical protein N9L06_01260 [Mariniblastus sp.]|nr:hypothetical protein [Mariniblastus sp.]